MNIELSEGRIIILFMCSIYQSIYKSHGAAIQLQIDMYKADMYHQSRNVWVEKPEPILTEPIQRQPDIPILLGY